MDYSDRLVNLIVDLQFGSTGKGLIAGYLAKAYAPDTVVTAWAANAGHTFVAADGRKFVHTMLANGVVSPNLKRLMLGAGSLINMDSLLSEIESCKDLLKGVDIVIHENAAVILQRHRNEESVSGDAVGLIGSTRKGCGAAAINRIRRDMNRCNIARELVADHPVSKYVRVVSVLEYSQLLGESKIVQIEGAQGYSLSIYHGFYPYVTSRDVSTAQILADCCIPYRFGELNVVGCARTYPIRVANRFDEQGVQTEYSGVCYDDQREVSFESLGQAVELTTVTKLPRRIFTFSKQQIEQAIRQCGVNEVFLNFCNYVKTSSELDAIVSAIESTGTPVLYKGFGSTEKDVVFCGQTLKRSVEWATGQRKTVNLKGEVDVKCE